MSGCFNIIAIIVLAIVPLTELASSVSAGEIQVSRFGTEGLTGWESKVFKGKTDYQLLQENGRTVVKAVSRAAASGMVRKIHFDPSTHRYLRWSWKVAHTIQHGNETTKVGDDFAARIYVIFPGRFFWQMKAINYIWANRLPVGEHVPNPFTSGAMMLAVESGNSKSGQWQLEERDLLADYRLLFGADPQSADAIAIMTDTDNTGENAEAWYGDISLSTVPR